MKPIETATRIVTKICNCNCVEQNYPIPLLCQSKIDEIQEAIEEHSHQFQSRIQTLESEIVKLVGALQKDKIDFFHLYQDALEKHVHNGHLGPQSCWFCKVLTELPHTDRLVKQRAADLAVIEAAKNVQCSCELASRLSGHNIDCTTWPMYEALDERERVYKGEI